MSTSTENRISFTTIHDADEEGNLDAGILGIQLNNFKYICEFPIEYMQEESGYFLKKEQIEEFKNNLLLNKECYLFFTDSGNIGGPMLKYINNDLIIQVDAAVGFCVSKATLKIITSDEKNVIIIFLDWLISKI